MKISTLLFLLLSAFSLNAQNKLDKNGGPLVIWDNSKAFNCAPKLKALDWSTYAKTWDGKLYLTWFAYAGAGVSHGMREAYHADPYCFEKKWGVGNESFWGSDAWKRNYQNNDPDQPHKHEFIGNVGRDIWHTAGAASKVVMFSATLGIGVRKQPIKYKILNALIGYGIQSAFATLTYNSLRQ